MNYSFFLSSNFLFLFIIFFCLRLLLQKIAALIYRKYEKVYSRDILSDHDLETKILVTTSSMFQYRSSFMYFL